MKRIVGSTLIIASLYIASICDGHAFDVDETVDDEIRKNPHSVILLDDMDYEIVDYQASYNYSANYNKVKYYGMLLNDEIVKAELEADLLVNPRPTSEEFTKYSFPSKNIEYMGSATPLVTTVLPSMPEEYYQYVFLFKDESVEGYKRVLEEIIKIPSEQLKEKGRIAQQFILENKTNYIQTRKIISMITNK